MGVPDPVSTTVWGPVAVKVLIALNEIPLTVLVVIQYGPTTETSTVMETVFVLLSAVSATYLPDIAAPAQIPPLSNVYIATRNENKNENNKCE